MNTNPSTSGDADLASETATRTQRQRVLGSAIIGSALEWYDFYLYAQAAALIFNKLFFPTLDPLVGTLAAFGSYAVGFLARPFGGIFFGRLGDRIGRKNVLIITLLIMGFGTVAIGLLPTYAAIGVAAPILLTLLRMVQGLAAGAEFGGAVVLSAELAPRGRRGLYASLPGLGVSLGVLMAAGTFALFNFLPAEQFDAWGWRMPFLLSIVIVGVALFIRLRVNESPVFRELEAKGEVSKAPIRDLFRYAKKPFFIAFGARIAENGTAYMFQAWILTYVVSVGLDRGIGLAGVITGTAISLVTIPLWGWATDHVGRKKIYLFGTVGMGLVAFPFFGLVNTLNPALVILALAVLISVFYQAMFASQASMLVDLFDPRFRFTGIALARETSAVVAGGIAPLVATGLLLAFGGAFWPIAIYVIVMCAISTVALILYKEPRLQRTKGAE